MRTYARFCISFSPFPSLSLSLSSLVAFHGTHGRRDGRGIHHLAPHGRYTSNTLRVSQLTPSQTFHFVVQRARHGAHDGSHKWKPHAGRSDATVCFLFPWRAEAGRERNSPRGAHPRTISYPEDRSHFCANPAGVRDRISDSASSAKLISVNTRRN